MPVLNQQVKYVRVSNAVAVGTTAVNSAAVDMTGYDSVSFVVAWGTITDGTPALKAQQDTSSGMGTAADLAGSNVTVALADDNKCTVLEIHKPIKGFVRCVVSRGGATGAVIDSIIAILSGPGTEPTTHDATTVSGSKALVSPAEGTP